MVNIKKQQVSAYILLESLIGMALLGVLTLVVLVEISKNRTILTEQNKQIEVLNIALMAYDSDQLKLIENGVAVSLEKTDNRLVITSSFREVIRLEILQETP